jgi:hypothetical protein
MDDLRIHRRPTRLIAHASSTAAKKNMALYNIQVAAAATLRCNPELNGSDMARMLV